MEHVAIDLGGRESQICIRRPNNDAHLERRIPTAKLKAFFKTLEPSRVILETRAEAFAVARDAKAAGHDVRVVPATLVKVFFFDQTGDCILYKRLDRRTFRGIVDLDTQQPRIEINAAALRSLLAGVATPQKSRTH